MDADASTRPTWLDRPLSAVLPKINVEILLITLILILAVISRFYNVDARVMSHDEVNHVVPSYDLFMGRGYRHDPVTHGPMQFHLIALSYWLFGDNDLSSRVPAVAFSIATVAAVAILMRRYLGRAGGVIAGFLFLISPYMLFYGRYTRNEAFVGLFGVLTIYGVLRYLEKADHFSLYLLTAVTALHFTTKETVYIYLAQLLLFLAVILLAGVSRSPTQDARSRNLFIILIGLALALLMIALGVAAFTAKAPVEGALENQPSVGATAGPLANLPGWEQALILGGVGAAAVLAVLAVVFLVRAIGWQGIRQQRSFDLLILLGTLILPQLAAFPVKMVGWNPLDYSNSGMLRTGIFVAVLAVISVLIGLWWKPRVWLISAGIFYTIFTVFYTTFFTNGRGFWTGLVGSLGYWLSQQGVQRGTQPLYYYALIQVPIYEYLAALGTILALYYGLRHNLMSSLPGIDPARQSSMPAGESTATLPDPEEQPQRLPVLALLVYWSVTALLAYSVAGERMPWLTVHIALPMLLAAGWGLGFLVDSTPWKKIANLRGLLVLLLFPVLYTSLSGVFGALLGDQPPFQGNALEQLEATNTFVISLIALIVVGYILVRLLKDWSAAQVGRLVVVTFFALLAVLTIRTAARASYVNYNNAKEYLVYAHAAAGPKEILAQIEEISRRTTGGKEIGIAYDNDALYPYWWYLRDYPNHRWFTDKPTRDLGELPLIIASENNYSKMDSIVKDNYVAYEYMRLWWPNQDYYNLTWERIRYVLTNPEMRSAIFDIWLERDYTQYAALTNNSGLDLQTWVPGSKFRFYIRKDIVAQIWNYGAAPVLPVAEQVDPYVEKMLTLAPDAVIGSPGSEPGQLSKPRGLRAAADGSLYVADSGNHRIQHFDADGALLQSWGTFADATQGDAPGGTFYEPWDVAVGPDGSVYVTDTWNHRVQKFTADGQFVKMWGYFGQGEVPEAFWGPRGIAVDAQGRVYVADTGNKRIVIFTGEGEFITQFGSEGMDPGQFSEPVGVAVDAQGRVYVTDTWNQRMQAFQPDETGTVYTPALSWDVSAWYGQSLDNKPFAAVDAAGNVYITDPEGYRVLEFDPTGAFLRGWGGYSPDLDGFGLAAGVTVDPEGRVWVSDAANMRLLRFTMPD